MRKWKITVYFINGEIETYIGSYDEGIRNLHIHTSDDKYIVIPYVNMYKYEKEIHQGTVLRF